MTTHHHQETTMTTTTTPTRCESCTGLAGGPRCGDIGWYYISPDATTCRLPKDRPVALCDDCYSLAPELATPTILEVRLEEPR